MFKNSLSSSCKQTYWYTDVDFYSGYVHRTHMCSLVARTENYGDCHTKKAQHSKTMFLSIWTCGITSEWIKSVFFEKWVNFSGIIFGIRIHNLTIDSLPFYVCHPERINFPHISMKLRINFYLDCIICLFVIYNLIYGWNMRASVNWRRRA